MTIYSPVTIYSLTGGAMDSGGNLTTRAVAVTVDGTAPAAWGAKILEWIQPLPESQGPIILGTPSDWKMKAAGLLPGQRLYLEPGNYGNPGETFSWSRGGAALAPVTISGIPGEARPVVRGKISLAAPYQRWSLTSFRGPTGNVGGPGTGGEANFVNLDSAEQELSNCEIAYSQWHAGISGSDASSYRILGCYIHDNGGYLGDYTDSQNNTSHGLYLSPSSYGLVANCLIEHNDAKGLMGRHTSNHLLIVHNTIVANGRYGSNVGDTAANNWVWANNIFQENGRVKGGKGLGTSGVAGPFWNRHNVFWRNGTDLNSHYDTGANVTVVAPLVADPKFVHPALYTPQQDPAPNWDHHLMAGSPAIGYGDPDYSMPTDIDGSLRSGRYDCGAYQGVV